MPGTNHTVRARGVAASKGLLEVCPRDAKPIAAVGTRDRRRRGRRFRRAGIETLELILVTPIIVILLVATLQFGSVHLVQEAITHAAKVGAREAAKGAPIEEVAVSIDAVLEPHGIDVADKTINMDGSITYTPKTGTRVFVEYGPDSVTVESFGDTSVGTPPTSSSMPTLAEPEVRVSVLVRLEQAPILSPEALKRLGFTFSGDRYEIRAVARLE
jgi:Flp pilus assembly protein TadG